MRAQKITSLLSLFALLPITSNCAYRESSNGDNYHSRILLTEASPVFAADGTLNRVSLDKNFNPNVPNP